MTLVDAQSIGLVVAGGWIMDNPRKNPDRGGVGGGGTPSGGGGEPGIPVD